jgi:hypothetical protein
MKFLIAEPSPLQKRIPLVQNIRLRILFSNTLNLHSSHNVRDHVSQPYSTTDIIIVLCILISKFLERIREDKRVWTTMAFIDFLCVVENKAERENQTLIYY